MLEITSSKSMPCERSGCADISNFRACWVDIFPPPEKICDFASFSMRKNHLFFTYFPQSWKIYPPPSGKSGIFLHLTLDKRYFLWKNCCALRKDNPGFQSVMVRSQVYCRKGRFVVEALRIGIPDCLFEEPHIAIFP